MSEAVARKLLRRAETLDKKAGELFRLVLAEWGNEHPLSDFADNLISASEDLAEALYKTAHPPSGHQEDL